MRKHWLTASARPVPEEVTADYEAGRLITLGKRAASTYGLATFRFCGKRSQPGFGHADETGVVKP